MAKIIWTKKAFSQFQRIVKFIYEEEGLSSAEIVRIKILQVTSLLGTNPQMGTVEPLLTHKKFHYRFLVVWSYKIIYRTTSDKVIISRVFHTSRNPKSLEGHDMSFFFFCRS